MANANDIILLREFADQNSETAFAEWVRRRINLVYSVAMRFTGNYGDAEDVTHAAYIMLALKAAHLEQGINRSRSYHVPRNQHPGRTVVREHIHPLAALRTATASNRIVLAAFNNIAGAI